MKILSRICTVCLLLGSLGYASYAFGKYFLSTKLFGQAVGAAARTRPIDTRTPKMAESMTRHVEYKSDKPHVEVQVLPAQDSDPGPAPPPMSATERSTHHADGDRGGATASDAGATGYDTAGHVHSGDKIVTPNDPAFNDSSPNFYGDGDHAAGDHPRRRHRKKKVTADAATALNARAEGSADTATSGASGTDSAASREVSGVGSDDTSRGQSSHRASASDDSGSTVRHSTSRHHRHESGGGESPIPRPEGEASPAEHSSGASGASESPIPQPE